jgi:hypothetical protein
VSLAHAEVLIQMPLTVSVECYVAKLCEESGRNDQGHQLDNDRAPMADEMAATGQFGQSGKRGALLSECEHPEP